MAGGGGKEVWKGGGRGLKQPGHFPKHWGTNEESQGTGSRWKMGMAGAKNNEMLI